MNDINLCRAAVVPVILPLFQLQAKSEVPVSVSERQQPNILLIVADDAGYADFGFMNSDEIKTPNLDALAAQGTVFTDAHVAATVSSPSRAMLMTGRYGQRFGYECNTVAGEGLPCEETILPQLLKDKKGYRTACVGKWHLGTYDSQHPNQKGFDDFYGLIAGGRNYYYDAEKDDKEGSFNQYQYNGKPLAFDGYFTDELSRRAKELIHKDERPFMMYLSYTAPHSPNQATPEDLKRFEGCSRQTYAAMLYALDRGVGEVVTELKRTGKFNNTLIFFLSDNGGATTNNACNLPLKGFKGNKFEGGHRVPFFFTWGNRVQNTQPFTGLTSSLDIYATIADVLGLSQKELSKPIDGISLLPYVQGKKKGNPHQTLYWRKMDSRAVRDGDYKLILTAGVDTVLYNLNKGLDECDNLIYKEPKKAKQLIKMLSQWEERVCIKPLWIENGWQEITNGYHERLMNNEIKTARDLKEKRSKK